MRVRRPLRLLPLAALAAGACESPLSTLDPAGPGAAPITAVWWVMFWASLAILAIVVALALYAVLKHSGGAGASPNKLLIIGGGVVWPGVTIAALLVYGIHSGHALLAVPTEPRAFQVEITGHQWWWEVRYPEAFDGEALHDANEIHIPAGRPVDVHITTADVIHSFWVPRLGGKKDAIPGISNVIRIEADAPGVYRGVCAEFCGAQHARMGFIVRAHEADALEEALADIATAAPSPDDAALPGAELFQTECAFCHSIETGVREPAIGPNLARAAARTHIGAGWIPNDGEALRTWLRDHQDIKPGNHMPVLDHLSDDEIDAVAEYLETIP